MLDFIWTLAVQLRGTRNKWTLQKILVHGRIQTTNIASLDFQRVPLTTRLLGQLTIDEMWLELLQHLFSFRYYKNSVSCAKGYTENENKIIPMNWWLIPFKYEMINTKKEIYYVLNVNDYI